MNNTFGKFESRPSNKFLETDDHCSVQLAFTIPTILGTRAAD